MSVISPLLPMKSQQLTQLLARPTRLRLDSLQANHISGTTSEQSTAMAHSESGLDGNRLAIGARMPSCMRFAHTLLLPMQAQAWRKVSHSTMALIFSSMMALSVRPSRREVLSMLVDTTMARCLLLASSMCLSMVVLSR